MESDEVADLVGGNRVEEGQALNSTIIDYYKKFGRKRDLEQFFSLSTAQGEIRDPSSLFWRRMKAQNESSDSGERSQESSLEVCRISIKCSVPDLDPASSQDDNPKSKSDTESPPIIVEEIPDTLRHSDDDSVKSDDNNSQKSMDANLDTSINKALSPSSSITSQRKLEWDSLADVGYTYESDKKTSASSLSTLERLALKQQYSNNDTKEDLGAPTAHSTPVDENDPNPKGKKGSKTTKIYRRDVDFLQVNMPQGSSNPSQSINVNLTKHISFNVEKDGGVSVDNIKKNISVTPEKVSVEAETVPQVTMDKEIQTSLIKTKDKSSSSTEAIKTLPLYNQGIPVLISLNSLKKRNNKNRRRKLKIVRRKLTSKKKMDANKENLPVLEKSGEQVSEAESFEYMPGHIYNQNQMNNDNNEPRKSNNSGNKSSLTAGNKSSLESSAPTTDSSKGSRHSFTKDLEKSIKMLRAALHKRYDDSELKEKLIKEVVQRLIKSNYRDDDTTTDFLSGLSFSSKKLGLGGNTTTSTSDANNTAEKPLRPKKSILRVDRFNANAIASTSQSVPNIPCASNSEKPISTKLAKAMTSTNTESDVSSKGKTSSDNGLARTSSEELYQKYLDALRREEAYRKHLREKEMFLKQKLVSSESMYNLPQSIDANSKMRLQELMKDLTRNNYDDGSGDASKLEGGLRHQARSHSIFTLSSQNSDQNRRSNRKNYDLAKPGNSRDGNHYCCCPHHYSNKLGVTDSSVQVNINNEERKSQQKHICLCSKHVVEEKGSKSSKIKPMCACNARKEEYPRHNQSDSSGDQKNVCLCNKNVATESQEASDKVVAYKCSKTNKGNQQRETGAFEMPDSSRRGDIRIRDTCEIPKTSKCSQTNLQVNSSHTVSKDTICIHEAIRCTQTDISINPKISDPVLTDIKIINKRDCCKLICEQYRKVSKSSLETEARNQDVLSDSDDSTIFSGDSKRKRRMATQTANAETQSDKGSGKKISGDFTIPIQGTNMTLKVCVGGSDANAPGNWSDDYPQGGKQIFDSSAGPMKVNTALSREGYSNLQSQSLVNPQEPYTRTNTDPGGTGISASGRNNLIDEYYARQQQSKSYSKVPPRQVETQETFRPQPSQISRVRKEESTGTYFNTEDENRRREYYERQQREQRESPRSIQSYDPQYQRQRGDRRIEMNPNRYHLDSARSRETGEGQNAVACINKKLRQSGFRKPGGPDNDKESLHGQCSAENYERNERNREYQRNQQRKDLYGEGEPQSTDRSYNSETYPQADQIFQSGTTSGFDVQQFGNNSREGQAYNIVQPSFGRDNVKEPPGSARYDSRMQESGSRRRVEYDRQTEETYNLDPGFRIKSDTNMPKRSVTENYGNIPERKQTYRDPSTGQYYDSDERNKEFGTVAVNEMISENDRFLDKTERRHYRDPTTGQYYDRDERSNDNEKYRDIPEGIVGYSNTDQYSDVRSDRSEYKNTKINKYDERTESRDNKTGQYVEVTPSQSIRRGSMPIQGFVKDMGDLDQHRRYSDRVRFEGDVGSIGFIIRNEERADDEEYLDERTEYLGPNYDLSENHGNQSYLEDDSKTDNIPKTGIRFDSDRSPHATPRRDNLPQSGDDEYVEYNKQQKVIPKDDESGRVRYNSNDDAEDYAQTSAGPHSPRRRSESQTGFQDPNEHEMHISPRLQEYIPGSRTNSPRRLQSQSQERRDRSLSPVHSDYGHNQRLMSPSLSNNDNQKYDTRIKKRRDRSRSTSPKRPLSPAHSEAGKRNQSPDRPEFGRRQRSPSPKQPELAVTGTSIEGTKSRANQITSHTSKPNSASASPRSKTQSPKKTVTDNQSKRPSSPYHQHSVPADFANLQGSQKEMQGMDKRSGSPREPQSSDAHTSSDGPKNGSGNHNSKSTSKDLIMNVIQGITERYSKKDLEKGQRKKAFKEIIAILKYLLETEDTTDSDTNRIRDYLAGSSDSDENKKYGSKESSSDDADIRNKHHFKETSDDMHTETITFFTNPSSKDLESKGNNVLFTIQETASQKHSQVTTKMRSVGSETETTTKTKQSEIRLEKKFVDKGVQLTEEPQTSKSAKGLKGTESSDIAQTTDIPSTSTESATCRVLNKIRRECEKYHQRRCKSHQNSKKCECNESSTSISCDQCKRAHHCSCRTHKCRGHKRSCEKVKKKCIAYNLIIQTSDSMISEEPAVEKKNFCRPLKNIIVKVPPKKKIDSKPYKEVITSHIPSPRYEARSQRSRSLPNEYLSSTDEGCKRTMFTVREYLEKNRPDFCEQYEKRQSCLKMINECRANERAAQRQLLSMQVQVDGAPLKQLSAADLRRLAARLGLNLNTAQDEVPPKLISERDMKKHSEKIYRSLPEQVRKKEETKKESIKKTNLLMANLFKKNLQRKTLRGAVNLSNYSKVIKI